MAASGDHERTIWVSEKLTGWGRSSYATSQVAEPSSDADVVDLLRRHPDKPILARGAGRSYGDTALNGNGLVIRMSRMAAVYSFDPESGEIVVGPGVTFGQLLHSYGPQGWIAPVTPGTQFATIGGAIANDVHGKNHETDGSFGDHLLWFDLVLADGTLTRVDVVSAPQLFAATLGGIGLTGIITRACFRMKKVPGAIMLVRERRIGSLDEYLDTLREIRDRYCVGWIDGIAMGRKMGRGILETADHIDDPRQATARRTLRMPIDLPRHTINSLTVKAFNQLYYSRVPARGRERRLDLERFFYPLDSILDWNRLYGRSGFVQFQCVVPATEARRALSTLLGHITRSGRASFLAVIKTLGRSGQGYLSFPQPGVTLALDFPRTAGIDDLLCILHNVTIDHGGRVYLAKDSCLTTSQFRQMYPTIPAFQSAISQADPRQRIRSDMALRLHL